MNIEELVNGTGITALVLGLPGKGKTSCVRNFPVDRTVILTSEPHGLQPLIKWGWKECRVEAPEGRKSWMEVVKNVVEDPKIDYIVIDTLSSCHDSYMEQYIKNKAANGKAVHTLGLDLYRVANLQFQEMLRELLKATKYGKDLVLLVHLKYRETMVDGKIQQNKEPSLSDNLCLWLARKCGLTLRAEAVRQGQKTNYFLISEGSMGDYGCDKYDVCEAVETNDLWAIFQRIRKKKPTKEPHHTKAAEDKEPHRAKSRAYEEFLDLATELKVPRPEAIDWLVNFTGKTVLKLKAADIKKGIKEFEKKHWIEK